MDEPDALAIAARLSQLIRIPTLSGDQEAFDRFVDALRELFPLVHANLESERIGERAQLYRWRGTSDRDPLILMAHIDVVPASTDEGWSRDPFSGAIVDGWVHGRGALDDKGPLVVILEAVEKLLSEGFRPARDVYLSFGGDEEALGGEAENTARVIAERGITPFLVLDEGGAVVDAPLPFVSGRAAMIGVGEKGVVTMRLEAVGDGGHASAPNGPSAIDRIVRALRRLSPATFPPRTPRTITRMLEILRPRAGRAGGLALGAMARLPWLTGRILGALGGEPAALVRTTIAATRTAGGSADNVLPPSASATLNLRLIPGDTVASVRRRVERRIADARVTVTVSEGADPSPESPIDGPEFAAVTAAVREAYPDALPTPYLMMQASDARFFHRRFPAVYRFAPLEMSREQRSSVHGPDERVEASSLERGRAFHTALIRGLA
ncbi:M20/M25/M40 family metallo-hydrolase [Microbacterium indicum]|uniref:M20/M25/M40 family metallo-hydrolase n=1 Tax=Microbacterium indicum TaxID=358100 RepID=UPI0004267CD9|nr:M20/M25/M40 family metallo-hydrolase [Microbacterium indicum]